VLPWRRIGKLKKRIVISKLPNYKFGGNVERRRIVWKKRAKKYLKQEDIDVELVGLSAKRRKALTEEACEKFAKACHLWEVKIM
jgi:hypothetical protein